jgi:uncharacterized protein YhaN
VRDLPGGLTIFYGPNGSGKSTVFAFLRQLLFAGVRPDIDGRAMQFQGGAGRLTCTGSSGAYTIARRSDASSSLVTRHGGAEGPQTDLDSLFAGADNRHIASLLAFDVQDLRTLPPLTSPVLRERLFPAGAGRGLRSVQRALDAIEMRKSEFAQRVGGEPNRLPAIPAELQARIDRATQAAGRVCHLLQAQSQARLTLELRSRSVADLKTDSARYAALVELSPIWQELTQARRELGSIEAVDDFPTDPEERLSQALAAREAAERSVAQLIDFDRPRRDAAGPADGGFAGTTDARPPTVVRQRVRLQELAPTTTDDLTAWQGRLKEVVEATRSRQRELDETTRTVRELEMARDEMSATLSRPEPTNIATLDEEARLVQHVRTTLAQITADQTSTKRLQDQIAERSATVRSLETQVVTIPSSLLPPLAWLMSVAGVAAAAWRYTEADLAGLALLAASSLLFAVGGAVLRARRAKALEHDATRRTDLGAARAELERACQGLLHHQERGARRRFDISVDSVRLELPPAPSDRQLQQREAELEAQRQLRTEWDKAQSAIGDTRSALVRNEDLRTQQAQSLLTAQALERDTIQQWHQWKIQAGLADDASTLRGQSEDTPTEADLLETCRRLQIQIVEWEQSAADWNTRARAALVAIAESEGSVSGGGVMLAPPAAEQQIAPPALQAARRRLRQCEDALAQLFAQAGVSNETAFRARLEVYRRRLVMTKTVRACEQRWNERIRREPAADAILRELPEAHVEEWRLRAERSAAELTSLESARDEVLRQLHQIDGDVRTASAESADLPLLEAERAGLVAEALGHARTWRTLTIAASVLADARRQVERDSQPAALRRASEALTAVTFSRYERVDQSEDQHELRVFDTRSGGWKSVDELSQGTVEQLYFSLRLGLAEESAQHGARLPLIIDDVLDHFDNKRSHAMAREVVELSRRHQILVFTRRPETCDTLRSLDPSVNIVTMQEL